MGMLRGLLGVLPREEGLVIDPQFGGPFSRVKTRLVYRGSTLELTLEGNCLAVRLLKGKSVAIIHRGKEIKLTKEITLKK